MPTDALFPTEREISIDNLLVRVHSIIEMSSLALRHGSLNSLFQLAFYLPSEDLVKSKGALLAGTFDLRCVFLSAMTRALQNGKSSFVESDFSHAKRIHTWNLFQEQFSHDIKHSYL